MQLLNKFDNGIRFLFCVIDIFSKYAQVVTFKDKNGITITVAYQKLSDESGRKPNKMANHGQIKMIQKYRNEEKSVVVERFIGTLKNKIYKYITLISKNVNVDKLGDIVRKYNNAYHRTTKMKLIDVKPKPKINLIKKIIIKILNLILAIM